MGTIYPLRMAGIFKILTFLPVLGRFGLPVLGILFCAHIEKQRTAYIALPVLGIRVLLILK